MKIFKMVALLIVFTVVGAVEQALACGENEVCVTGYRDLSNSSGSIGFQVSDLGTTYDMTQISRGFEQQKQAQAFGSMVYARRKNGTFEAFCASIDTDYNQCKQNSQSIYMSTTSSCKWAVIGGAGGAGAVATGVALISNPAGWVIGGIIVVGASSGALAAWGSTSCYSDAASIRDYNLSICDSNLLRSKDVCRK